VARGVCDVASESEPESRLAKSEHEHESCVLDGLEPETEYERVHLGPASAAAVEAGRSFFHSFLFPSTCYDYGSIALCALAESESCYAGSRCVGLER
jgi:hypothetical protein